MREQRYLTVNALNRYLKAKVDSDVSLSHLLVQGELSNVKYHYSGHCYFTLKDEKSRINAIMFASALKRLPFRLEDGMKVLVAARLSIYEPHGTYQLYVEKMTMDGLGNLYMAYEKLKEKLEKQGLFALEHKKNIPLYATKIGVITAATGAAIHDIVQTIHLRCPSAKVFFYPSLVQGEQAPENLVEMLHLADKANLDVLIIARGGGSLEDLWAFNDERLAYAIYEAQTPIISGVGHESDVTICDFVADARAATPTAAASQATFIQADLEKKLQAYSQTIRNLLERRINQSRQKVEQLSQSRYFNHPENLYQNAMMHLDDLTQKLVLNMALKTSQKKQKLHDEQGELNKQMIRLYHREKERMNYQSLFLERLMLHRYESEKKNFIKYISQLNAYSPLQVLERGYTLVLQNQQVVTSKAMIDPKKRMIIRFKDGDLEVISQEGRHEKNEL